MLNKYFIDDSLIEINIDPNNSFIFGNKEILSNKYNDITKNKKWFNEGYCVKNSKNFFNYKCIREEIKKTLKKIIKTYDSSIDLKNFDLENYHNYVDDELHKVVINKTRRLYSDDFGFNTASLIKNFSSYFNANLSFRNPINNITQWIILRIIKPNSLGFNPAHKDIYESFDKYNKIPRMMNIWIPVAGVNHKSGLPIAPRSHLIDESKIHRTLAGSLMNSNKYSVNLIKSWNKETKLKSIYPQKNKFLIFSSHLIHGLAINKNTNKTRMSLEFRLYENKS